ncbi:MAG: methyltransferase, partial [Promethearchaeota archaeon]
AKNLIKDNPKLELPITKACIIEFDAREKFGINTPAAIFVAETYRGPTSGVNKQDRCKRFKFLGDKINFIGSFGWYANKFVSDISTYQPLEFIDGKSQLEWRQGLKHDLSKVLVLTRIKENTFMNGFGEQISIEEKHVYPFIKSSDLNKNNIIRTSRYHVIVPQKKVGQQLDVDSSTPRLLSYLNSKIEHFKKRKSRVYKNKPVFSIFGIGNYSFKPYKVGVSGFYKDINFSLILPINNKPPMLDDTCYFLSFDDLESAAIVWVVLNTDEIKTFLKSIVFLDSKRPYTKEILMRIDLKTALERIILEKYLNHDDKLKLPEIGIEITRTRIKNFIRRFENPTRSNK